MLEGSNTKINVPDVPQHNVLNHMLTNCSLLNTDSIRGKEIENKNVDSIMNCKYKNTRLENTL